MTRRNVKSNKTLNKHTFSVDNFITSMNVYLVWLRYGLYACVCVFVSWKGDLQRTMRWTINFIYSNENN